MPGSLHVGAAVAKGLAIALGVPLVDVNHLHGHVLSHFIKEDENTGELSYPTIWIKGGIKQFEKYVVSQDAFNHHETNQKLIDAADTDKVTIE